MTDEEILQKRLVCYKDRLLKERPHPSDKQRRELGRELGLEPLQVKFWFQNKRNQMKMQHEHQENIQLRTMNERLRAENKRYQEALCNVACAACGWPLGVKEMSREEHQLKMENARLRAEIDHMLRIAAMYVGKPVHSTMNHF